MASQSVEADRERPHRSYEQAFRRVFHRLDSMEQELRHERLTAPLLFSELMRQPAGRRELLISNCPRFHAWGVCELLLDEAQRQADRGALEEASQSARLALSLTRELSAREEPERALSSLCTDDLQGRAWLIIATAHLAAGRRVAARRDLVRAGRHLGAGTGDPIEQSRLLAVTAFLHLAEGKVRAATRRLLRGVAACLHAGEQRRAIRLLRRFAQLCREDHPDIAAGLLQRALELQPDGDGGQAALPLDLALIDALVRCRKWQRARSLLPAIRKRALTLGRSRALLELRWLDGRIAAGLGELRRAALTLDSACDAFARRGLRTEQCAAGLDLAAVRELLAEARSPRC